MKRKRWIAGLLAAALCLCLAACGAEKGGGAAEGTALTIAITNDENNLAPFTYVSSTGLTVNRLV